MNAITEPLPAVTAAATPAKVGASRKSRAVALRIDPPADMRGAIIHLSLDPAVDPAKIAALWQIQREMEADQARLEYSRAMNAVQVEIEPVVRDTTNTQTNSKYARLETIHAAIQPVYARHGFSLEFDTEQVDDNHIRVVCEVSHIAGHSKRRTMTGALDIAGFKGTSNKTPIQGTGSSATYLRRYLTCLAFNVPLADDNDGNRQTTRDDGELITRDQVAELRALIAECSAGPGGEQRFLGKMGLGSLGSIADITPRDFPRLRTALVTKRTRMRAAQTTGEAA